MKINSLPKCRKSGKMDYEGTYGMMSMLIGIQDYTFDAEYFMWKKLFGTYESYIDGVIFIRKRLLPGYSVTMMATEISVGTRLSKRFHDFK